MRKLLLLGLALLPAQAEAQEKAGRTMLEAGLVGGSGDACPGRYVGIKGRVAGPVSLYGMVETYRCADFAGSANRIGTSVRLGRERWFVRPALRAGVEYDGGDVSPTAGASLTVWTALRRALHPPPRGGRRGHPDALPDGRVRFVLSPPRPARGRLLRRTSATSPQRGLDGLPARDRWTGATLRGGCPGCVHPNPPRCPHWASKQGGRLSLPFLGMPA